MTLFEALFDCMSDDTNQRRGVRVLSARMALDNLRELKETPERQYRHLSYSVWLTHYVRMVHWNFIAVDGIWPREAPMRPEELLVCKEEADLWWRAQSGEDTEPEWLRRFANVQGSASTTLPFLNRRLALLRACALPLSDANHVVLSGETVRAFRPSVVVPIEAVLAAYPNIGPSRDACRALIARACDVHNIPST